MSPLLFKQKQNEWATKLVEEAKLAQIGPITPIATTSKTTSYSSKSSSSSYSKPSTSTTKSKSSSTKSKTSTSKPKDNTTCPTCKSGHLVEKTAKASGKKFIGCDTWPKCNYVEWPK